jgi:hypothetical protein
MRVCIMIAEIQKMRKETQLLFHYTYDYTSGLDVADIIYEDLAFKT